jgi:deoxyribodipyrimidine photolyase-related protein
VGRPPQGQAPGGRLVLVLGDQLDRDSAAFDDFDPGRDRVWMAEVRHESRHVPSHKARSTLFLSAMRHFRDELRERAWTVEYRELGAHAEDTLAAALAADLARLRPASLRLGWRRPTAARSSSRPTGTSCARPRTLPAGRVAARNCGSSISTAGYGVARAC